MSDRLGFIGLGRMGLGMARNLARSGAPLLVHDTDPAPLETMTALGAQAPGSTAAVAGACDILFLCLPDAPQVRQVMQDVLAAAPTGLLVVDHSTMNRAAAIAIAEQAAVHGVSCCDCPISGLPARADEGTLTLMFGGGADDFQRAEPFLKVMGNTVTHVGEHGAGQLMKALNNIVYNINLAAVCEVLPLAVKAGVDAAVVARVLGTGSSRSFAGEHFLPRMLEGRFDGDYPLGSAYKDIVNLRQTASETGAMTPLAEAMTGVYQQAMSDGYGAEAKSAMLKVYEDVLDVKARLEAPGEPD